MDLGTKVKLRREELGWSQDELAQRMGYKSRSSINKIEMGRPISQKIIFRLAKVLDVKISYLLEIEEAIEENPVELGSTIGKAIKDESFLELLSYYNTLDDEKKKEAISYLKYLSQR